MTNLVPHTTHHPHAVTFDDILRQADVLAQSRIIPAAYRNRAPDVVAAGLAGLSFGWDVMTSLRNYHVIEGTASLRPEAMLGLVRRAGHSVTLTLRSGDEGREAVAHGRRADTGDEHTAIFSQADAQKAGLAKKKNWEQYLDSMLTWRAVSSLCRVLYPDVVLGAGYAPEEIGADVDQTGAPVEDDPFSDPMIPIPEAKRRVLTACDGDKDEARRWWESQTDLPSPDGIRESQLDILIAQIDSDRIQDADVISEIPRCAECDADLAIHEIDICGTCSSVDPQTLMEVADA
jgi:hypothetical protein